MPLARVSVGARLVVRPGAGVSTDGRVIDGRARVDASMPTDVSLPVAHGPGDRLVGGSINCSARIMLELGAIRTETVLARNVRTAEDAHVDEAPSAHARRGVEGTVGACTPRIAIMRGLRELGATQRPDTLTRPDTTSQASGR